MNLLSVKEASKILSVTEQTVRNLITRGELDKVKVGRAVRIKEQDLMEYIENNTDREDADRPETAYKPKEGVKYVSTREASRQLNKSLRTVQRYINQGKLEGYKDGKEWRINRESIQDYKGEE
ncbi:MAG: helix-turn-helix domain-containing protein [Halanaerobiaceae bacterium]